MSFVGYLKGYFRTIYIKNRRDCNYICILYVYKW